MSNGDIISFEVNLLRNINYESHPQLAEQLADYLDAVAVDGHVPAEDVIAAIYELAPTDQEAQEFISEVIEVLQEDGLVLAIVSDGGASSATIEVEENSFFVTSVLAVDPQNDQISYAITGGADASLFQIDAVTGELSFIENPDFENALDQNSDGIYEVTVQAIDSNSGQTDTQDISVVIVDVNEAPELAVGFLEATEDGAAVSLELATLGSDVDADDDGTTLSYVITGAPDRGSASIVGSVLTFDPGSEFQNLAEGETLEVVIQVTAVDSHGAVDVNDVTVTVTGSNDVPEVAAALSASSTEDDANFTIDLLEGATDIDDGETSTLSIQNIEGLTAGITLVGTNLVVDPTDAAFQSLDFGDSQVITVSYDVVDANGAAISQTATITIAGLNEPLTESFPAALDISSLNGVNGFSIAINTYAGMVSGAGDINGDGLDDLIIGNYFGGYATDPYGMGETYVIFGSASGFNSSIDPATLDGTNGFVIVGADPYDYAGEIVSSLGDINGDGLDDIIVGSPNGNEYAGHAFVVFGSASGFDASFDLSTLDGTNGFAIEGLNSDGVVGDSLSSSVSGAGDINGDGIDDFIIGANRVEANNLSHTGASYVVFGSASGFDASLDVSALDGSNGFVINGAGVGDLSGSSVSNAGDVNGDGIEDLIVGAPNAGENFSREGAAYVVFGSSDGFEASLDLSTLNGSNGFVIEGSYAEQRVGFSVSSAGDINGDGIDDLVIGAPRGDPNGFSNAGETYVVFGSTSGFDASFDLTTLDGSNGFVINGFSSASGGAPGNSGWSVSDVGDVNGDGIDDIVIGAPFTDANGEYRTGEAYVVFGSTSGFNSSLDLSNLDGTNGFVISGGDSLDWIGETVSGAGDLNGDGIDDIIVSSRNTGESVVIFGRDTFEAEVAVETEALPIDDFLFV